ncbi:MAG: cobyric acid synthase, partial [Lachnospiraceae bacterium]|nr:cobyric acid synthase [Lachnospiraceae bacterium]
QAYAAGLEPCIEMNPILLKPTGDTGSQVIVNGKPIGNMSAVDYFKYKKTLIPDIQKAFDKLALEYDPLIVEGAGSPAEINLKTDDIVNMGLAKMIDAPVLLVGDIDKGGVFAQLFGTVMLLPEDERSLIKGFIINKFRGDPSLLDSGISRIEELTGIPVLGVVPYIHDLGLEDEDSLTARFDRRPDASAKLIIGVIKLPRISNFSDLDPFEQNPDVSVVYSTDPKVLEKADMIVIPGSKNTIADLRFLHEKGLAGLLQKEQGLIPVFGICGGYQMLGRTVSDPQGLEGGGSVDGLGLLPIETVLQKEKIQRQVSGKIDTPVPGIFSELSGKTCKGYEIHMGRTVSPDDPESPPKPPRMITGSAANVYGTYVHGFFDSPGITGTVLNALAKKKGVRIDTSSQTDQRSFRNSRYDLLSDTIRKAVCIDRLYDVLCDSSTLQD